MTDGHDPHTGLHSEQGALRGEHPGRARNPVVKVHDLAWLEFQKPDLERAEVFARAFGFTTSLRTQDELHLRGTDPGSPACSSAGAPGPGSSAPRSGPPSRTTCCGSRTRPGGPWPACRRAWAG